MNTHKSFSILTFFFFTVFLLFPLDISAADPSKVLSKKEIMRRRQMFEKVKPPVKSIDPKKVSKSAIKEAKATSPILRQEIQQSSGDPFIVPNFTGSGVSEDSNNSNAITAEKKWERDARLNCTYSFSNTALCRRSGSLKEVLNKFTGTDDFYNSHCQNICKDGQIGALVGFEIDSPSGYYLRLVDSPSICTFQFGKLSPVPWEVVNLSAVNCVCIKETCQE